MYVCCNVWVMVVELFDPEAEKNIYDAQSEAASLNDAISVWKRVCVSLIALDASLQLVVHVL